MPGVQNENAVDERVDDVMFGIQKYGSMVATFFHASDENPIVPILAADFMSQLIAKLVEWNVLTEEQHTQRRGRSDGGSDRTSRYLEDFCPALPLEEGRASLVEGRIVPICKKCGITQATAEMRRSTKKGEWLCKDSSRCKARRLALKKNR